MSEFSAASDNPKQLFNRASRQMTEALRDDDLPAIREACEHLWLAVCAAIDVAGKGLGRPPHGGYGARLATLKVLGVGHLSSDFGGFRALLHGQIFYDDFHEDGEVLQETVKAAGLFIDSVAYAAGRK
jgi:hypothetical protein